jgi:FKBP-type peptidyl-prolyl cis-trans isomerase
MKPTHLVLVTGLSAVALVSCSSPKADLDSVEGKSSYAMGLDIGKAMVANQAEIDLPSLIAGLTDAIEQREPLLTEEETEQVLRELAMRMRQAAAERQSAAMETNKSEGAAYLADNASREGVVTTESGLQYEILEQGSGPKPAATDSVTVHYRGQLLDGTVFDSSYGGDPPTFPVSGLIPGWTEALQLMNVGGKYRLVIPSDLAYGEQGSQPVIGPNATLVFEVELLAIVN